MNTPTMNIPTMPSSRLSTATESKNEHFRVQNCLLCGIGISSFFLTVNAKALQRVLPVIWGGGPMSPHSCSKLATHQCSSWGQAQMMSPSLLPWMSSLWNASKPSAYLIRNRVNVLPLEGLLQLCKSWLQKRYLALYVSPCKRRKARLLILYEGLRQCLRQCLRQSRSQGHLR